jgi:hypothetical protein
MHLPYVSCPLLRLNTKVYFPNGLKIKNTAYRYLCNLDKYHPLISTIEDKNKLTTEALKATNRFQAWGDHAADAQKEGWYPVSWNNETTEYRNQYNNQMNQVQLPNTNERGYISAIGGKNGLFDLVIKDPKGNTLQYIHKGVPVQTVRNYFTSPQSTIAQRVYSIAMKTNPDRMINGAYTPLH